MRKIPGDGSVVILLSCQLSSLMKCDESDYNNENKVVKIGMNRLVQLNRCYQPAQSERPCLNSVPEKANLSVFVEPENLSIVSNEYEPKSK